jgi:uncharacterized protein YbjT (DUF2867 family)
MRILICGASGFVGRHLTKVLIGSGHDVLRGVRKPSQLNDVSVDFCKDITKEDWLPKLINIDVVVNAVGVLRDSTKQPMQQLHELAPIALFAACQESGVKSIVQISALGIDKGIQTAYFQTRRAAEAFLTRLPETLRWLILRPSLIYGEDGISAKMFRFQAGLPIHALPGDGTQRLQPVHIDDICTAVNRWLADQDAQSQIVDAVGLEATDLRGMLDSYRRQLQHPKAMHINIPLSMIRLLARLGDLCPASPMSIDTLTMLNAGNTGDAKAFTELLGQPPKSYQQFIQQDVDHASL